MSPNKSTAVNRISTYNEKPLHAALKEYCAEPGDRFEVAVDGSLIDIVRGKLHEANRAIDAAARKRLEAE